MIVEGSQMKVRVRCSFEVEIDVEDDVDPFFYIEDNGCPGTGPVGAAIDELIETASDNNTCWACGRNGENRIIEIDGVSIADDDLRHANG